MRTPRFTSSFTLLALLVISASAAAQKKPPEPVGVRLVTNLHPERGFVDEAFALDGTGARIAAVTSDGGSLAEVQVLDLAQAGAITARFDISAIATSASRIHFVVDGNKLLVIAAAHEEGKTIGALFDLSGKLLGKWGPATDVVLAEAEGGEAVVVFDQKAGPKGGMAYDVAAFRLDTGKAVGKRQKLVADADGFVKSIDMRVLYWQDGYTRLVGRKSGQYDRFKDQRMNDSEGTYDLLAGALVKTRVADDLVAYTKVLDLRKERSNQSSFLIMTSDLRGLERIAADDQRAAIQLAEELWRYEPKSLAQEAGRDGNLYFSMTVDPQNPDALSRKANDPELIDLYVLAPADVKATRLARLPRLERPFAWKVASGRWAVLRRHKGFSRGGPELAVYELTAAPR